MNRLDFALLLAVLFVIAAGLFAAMQPRPTPTADRAGVMTDRDWWRANNW